MSPKMLSLFVAALAALVFAPVSPAGVFRTATSYPSGGLPVAAVVRDFNNDGVSDIATANENGRNVSVFLGNHDGTFAPANNIPFGPGAVDIASGDLDGDGNTDLVVANGINSVNVALGRGDGSFDPASTIMLTGNNLEGSQGIAIADLNSDGILDLAITIYNEIDDSAGKVAILIGQGDGSFAPAVFYPVIENAAKLVARDLNNDGVPDLAVAIHVFGANAKGLAVLLGNGDGTFRPAVTSVGRAFSTDVAADDFNGDGNVDLALAQDFNQSVLVVLGKGDGTFQPSTAYSTVGSACAVSAADVSGDGVPDLMVSTGPTIFLGDGAGGFGAPVRYGIGGGFAEVGYFNDDPKADIVAGCFSEIDVAFGRGHGAFKAPLEYFTGNGSNESVGGFDLADFDGDGKADVVVSAGSQTGSELGLTFLHGLGDGTFADFVPIADVTGALVIATDFSDDSKADVLVVPSSSGQIYAILGNGDGTFQSPVSTTVAGGGGGAAVSDFNGDGKIDVVLLATESGQFTVLLGNGDGSFQTGMTTQTSPSPRSPTVADFNLDGNPDLAILSNAPQGTVQVYLGHGDGTFDPPSTIEYLNPQDAAAGDLNEDGKPDLVVGGDGLKVFLGNGDGTFGSPETVYSNYGPVKIADVDRDGHLDLALISNFDSFVVLQGLGDGTVRPAREFPTGNQFIFDFVLRDLNGDQTPEAIVSPSYQNLIVLLNTSHPR